MCVVEAVCSWSLCGGGNVYGGATYYSPNAQIHEAMMVDARTCHRVHIQCLDMSSCDPECYTAAGDLVNKDVTFASWLRPVSNGQPARLT